MKRLHLLLPSFFVASMAFPQATHPAGFVQMPDPVHCRMLNVLQAGGAGGQFVPVSVGSVRCKSAQGNSEQDIPLVSGEVKDGMLATRSFGDLYLVGGGLSFQMYVSDDQLQPLVLFLDAAPATPAPATASPDEPKIGAVLRLTDKKDIKFAKRAEGAKLGNTWLPSGKLVPAAPEGTVWRVRGGKIVLEQE